MTPAGRTVENTIPILPVTDLSASLAFYVDTLGFTRDWGGHEGSTIASVSRDGCHVMLVKGFAGAPPAWVWIGLEDDRLFDEWRERGVRVVQEPMNWSWAWEMKFADPDGNVLWLGTAPRDDVARVDGG